MQLDPSQYDMRGALIVHASKSRVPICKSPQAIEFRVDQEDGEVSITLVSADRKLTLDKASANAILRKWLPSIWGRSALENQLALDGNEKRWSLKPLEIGHVLLSAPGSSPNLEFLSADLEYALMDACSNGFLKRESNGRTHTLKEHQITIKPQKVRRLNNRIHDVAMEVDEVDL